MRHLKIDYFGFYSDGQVFMFEYFLNLNSVKNIQYRPPPPQIPCHQLFPQFLFKYCKPQIPAPTVVAKISQRVELGTRDGGLEGC